MLKFKNFISSKNFFYIVFLVFFSIVVNQYYGYVGILPIDSFLVFNSGYDFLNGYLPFKDYWTIKEPFIDLLQAGFFKIFGVSWFSYVLHASVFNLIISISTFYILIFFGLKSELSLFYSICVAILTYPTAGTPFSDHHTLILCIFSLYLFFVAIKTNNQIFWFLIPFFLGFAFLSKQAPTAYLVIIISFMSLIYFFCKNNFNGLLFSITGLIVFLILFFILLTSGDIKLKDFYLQYILFPQSLGATRLDWVFPLEFQRVVLRFKIHYLSLLILFYILFRNFYFKDLKIKYENILIITSLILTCFLFIFHQLMTINAIFIYCLIPIFAGFSNLYSDILIKKKIVSYYIILLTLLSTIYYFWNYVHNRTFMDLRSVDISKAIDAKIIDEEFNGIKWITMFYPEDPHKEISEIKLALSELEKDEEKKMIITDYQFISVLLGQYDYSVTRFWYNFHGYPTEDNKYFYYWKEFVIKRLKENNIYNIYVLKPLLGEEKPLENIFGDCLVRKDFSDYFYKLNIKNC